MKQNKFCYLNKKKKDFNIRIFLAGDKTKEPKNILLNGDYFNSKKEVNDIYHLVCGLNDCKITDSQYVYDEKLNNAVNELAANVILKKVYRKIEKLGLIETNLEKTIYECLGHIFQL